jgi:type II secretory pathway component PulM
MPINQAFRQNTQSQQTSFRGTVLEGGRRILAFFRLSAAPRWLAVFAGGLAVLTAIGAFVALRQPPAEPVQKGVVQELEGLKSQLAMVNADLDSLKKEAQAPLPGADKSQVAVRLGRLEGALTDLQSRQTKLEEIVLNNPARVLELHSLRRDLDELKENQQQQHLAVGHGMERIYILTKWLFGVMAVSIAVLAIGYWTKESREISESNVGQNLEEKIADPDLTGGSESTVSNDEHGYYETPSRSG